jgi:oligopeptide/dipeptide ABC transporter ATP-binding protein
MYRGRVVEAGRTEQVRNSPQHPYTQTLLAAIPFADGQGKLPVAPAGGVEYPLDPVLHALS